MDLKRSRNHQAVYTALSRGTSAETTVILRDFKESKIMGGISGFLRQEFRELDMLGEITELQFEGKLPFGVVQSMRASTLAAYRSWKTNPGVGCAPGNPPPRGQEGDAAKRGVKRTIEDVDGASAADEVVLPPKKRTFAIATTEVVNAACPWIVNWKWDSVDWSCAYDSYLSILRMLYHTYPPEVVSELGRYGFYMDYLLESFAAVERGAMALDDCRRGLRERLWALDQHSFPRGAVGTDIYGLVHLWSPDFGPS